MNKSSLYTVSLSLIGLALLSGCKENEKNKENKENKEPLITSNPLQKHQWHLNNMGQKAFSENVGTPGMDLNLTETHKSRITGDNIVVRVVDSGVEENHVNLKQNIIPGLNLINNKKDATPTDPNAHGTSVAGIIAAPNNGIGTLGVAPNAKISGVNLIEKGVEQSYAQELESYAPTKGKYDIYNLSLGGDVIEANFSEKKQFKSLERLIKDQVEKNNSVYVKAAGNEFEGISYSDAYFSRVDAQKLPMMNSNADMMNSSFWFTTIGAMNADGKRSSYSNIGSNVLLVAPAGEVDDDENGNSRPAIVTTDLSSCYRGYNQRKFDSKGDGLEGSSSLDPECEYTRTFSGTSAATPMVSGAVALIKSYKPSLTYRDIKDILIRSSDIIDRNEEKVKIKRNDGEDIIAMEGWQTNAAGFPYSPSYGFGKVNVDKAIALAKDHRNLPELKILKPVEKGSKNTTGYFNVKNSLITESVQVELTIKTKYASRHLIELISPNGTRSVLMTPYNSYAIGDAFKDRTDEKHFILLSHKFYGEPSQGEWKIKVIDFSDPFEFNIQDVENDELKEKIKNKDDKGLPVRKDLSCVKKMGNNDKPYNKCTLNYQDDDVSLSKINLNIFGH